MTSASVRSHDCRDGDMQGGRGSLVAPTMSPWQHSFRMALLSEAEIEARLSDLAGWERAGKAIRKSFECGDFVG